MAQKSKKQLKALDMRTFIDYHLSLYGLGKLVAVDGPKRGGRSNDQSWWELAIKYRPPGNESLRDVQFYDKRIDVYLGYSRKAGYWNRRNIRVAIHKEAKRVHEENVVEQVWKSAQLAITSGPIEL